MSSLIFTILFFHKTSKRETPDVCAVRRSRKGFLRICLLAAAIVCRRWGGRWCYAHRQRAVQFQSERGAGGQSCGTMLDQPVGCGSPCADCAADQYAYRTADQSSDEHAASSAAA